MNDLFIIEELGFKEEELDAIRGHFTITLDYSDFESMEIIDDDQEDDENFLNLPSGRVVYFPDELLYKETLSQID